MPRLAAQIAWTLLFCACAVPVWAQYENTGGGDFSVEQNERVWIRALLDVRLVHGGPAPSWTAELMEDTALLSVPARLAKRLLSLASALGREPQRGTKITLSQEELAQFLGLSRQIVNQHLQTWRAQNCISLGRGSITLENPQALEQIVRE